MPLLNINDNPRAVRLLSDLLASVDHAMSPKVRVEAKLPHVANITMVTKRALETHSCARGLDGRNTTRLREFVLRPESNCDSSPQA